MAQNMPANDAYKKLLIRIPPEVYAELTARSRTEDRSLNGVIIQLVRKGLAADRQQEPPALSQPAPGRRHLIRAEVLAPLPGDG